MEKELYKELYKNNFIEDIKKIYLKKDNFIFKKKICIGYIVKTLNTCESENYIYSLIKSPQIKSVKFKSSHGNYIYFLLKLSDK